MQILKLLYIVLFLYCPSTAFALTQQEINNHLAEILRRGIEQDYKGQGEIGFPLMQWIAEYSQLGQAERNAAIEVMKELFAIEYGVQANQNKHEFKHWLREYFRAAEAKGFEL